MRTTIAATSSGRHPFLADELPLGLLRPDEPMLQAAWGEALDLSAGGLEPLCHGLNGPREQALNHG